MGIGDDSLSTSPDSSVRAEIQSSSGSPPHTNDHLSDIFGSRPSSPDLENGAQDSVQSLCVEQSEIPRIKEKHEKEGYRDGVTEGKAETVQEGFDEGYGLGAVLGMRIGKILGLLEGTSSAVSSAVPGAKEDAAYLKWLEESRRLQALLQKAEQALTTRAVFDSQWWNEDGSWKFEVAEEVSGNQIVFADVARSHPLLIEWEAILDEEISTWDLDLKLMDRQHEAEVTVLPNHREAASKSTTARSVKQEDLAW